MLHIVSKVSSKSINFFSRSLEKKLIEIDCLAQPQDGSSALLEDHLGQVFTGKISP